VAIGIQDVYLNGRTVSSHCCTSEQVSEYFSYENATYSSNLQMQRGFCR